MTQPTELTPAAPPHPVLEGLNDRQREAVTHGGGPLLVVAGAGTGKTTVLAHRTAWHIAEGTPAGRILLLTFTRRAAAEMLRRVDGLLRLLGLEASGSRVWGGTFHAVAARLLRIHGPGIGLEPGFTVLDRSDAEDLMGFIRAELGLGGGRTRFPQKGTCLEIHSRCVDTATPLAEVLPRSFPWCRDHAEALGRLFAEYDARKARQAVLDYDDLLLFFRGLLVDPHEGPRVRERFEKVLVDEYQDTNAVQAEIVRLLRPDGSGLTVVGDDAQAVYGFRGATVRNILDFPAVFEDRARVVTLERNHRSTGALVEATNAVIAEAAERHVKELVSTRELGLRPSFVTCADEAAQTEHVVSSVLEQRECGVPLHRQAVLFRAAQHSADLELELARRDIPFRKYGGLRFVEAAHIKDLVAFLRLAENPRDATAGMRVLTLVQGVGPAAAERAVRLLAASSGDVLVLADARPPGAEAAQWSDLVSLLSTLRGGTGAAGPPLGAQVHAVRVFYGPLLERRYDNAAARLRDLEQLEALAGRFEDRSRLLSEMTLDAPSWAGDLAGPPHADDDWLVLSTMHSAKGLEWDAVFVIHAADGNVPSDMACGTPEEIEEERRLLYVACTRARDTLLVCAPLRYHVTGRGPTDRHGLAQPSRFLTREVLEAFDSRAAGGPDMGSAEDRVSGFAASSTTADSVRAALGQLWT
jgi:DNA helicase II / ATP-dependent DNA helicase PcrA